MIRSQSRLFESDHRDAGIPNRRDARLHTNGVFLFNFKAREFLDFAQSKGIVRTMTESHQRKNRIHDRRVDSGKTLAALDMVQHPGFRLAECPLPKWLPRPLLVEFQAAVDGQKDVFPGKQLVAPIERGRFVLGIVEQLVHTRAFRQPPVGTQRGQDRHRDHNAAGP